MQVSGKNLKLPHEVPPVAVGVAIELPLLDAFEEAAAAMLRSGLQDLVVSEISSLHKTVELLIQGAGLYCWCTGNYIYIARRSDWFLEMKKPEAPATQLINTPEFRSVHNIPRWGLVSDATTARCMQHLADRSTKIHQQEQVA